MPGVGVEVTLIFGIDGSLAAYGWGVINPGELLASPRVGCIITKPDAKSAHQYAADKDGVRVDAIARALLDELKLARALADHRLLVAIEAPAGSQHANGAKALGLAYGISRTACMALGIVPITLQAHEVKRAVGGSDAATKADVADGVYRLTGWRSTGSSNAVREGESDALANALTAMRHPMFSAMGLGS
jgi:Holliday junction resolvasome RuvABC endonuclease subunit